MEESILAGEEETLKAVSIPVPRAAQVYCWPPPQLAVTAIGCCIAPHNTLEGGPHWLASGQTLQAKGACLLLPVVGRHKSMVPTVGSAFLMEKADEVETKTVLYEKLDQFRLGR